MKATLAYGKTGITINIPEGYQVDTIEPAFIKGLEYEENSIANALAAPIGTVPLNGLAKPDHTIGIIFSDITRQTPYQKILPPLLRALDHVPDSQITLFCATGTHRPCNDGELITMIGAHKDRFRIIQNDVKNPEDHVLAGVTGSGNEIYLHRALMACDLIIPTGFIEPHLFAGFSGGGKAIMPGMAALSTIRHNHSIANLESTKASWGVTHENPIWEEVMDAAELAGKCFLLNVTMNRNKEITGVFAGDLREAHHMGCKFAKTTAMTPVSDFYDIVITSNSGYPLDLNIYQSVKGMSAAAQIVKPGGTIIIAAECWDGIPANSDYEKILSSASTLEGLASYIRKNERTLQDTWQVFYQTLIQQRATVYLYSHKLDDKSIRKAMLNPVDDISALVKRLSEDIGPGARICVMPEGPHTIPYVKPAKAIE